MSDSHDSPEAAHEGPIKTPKQLVLTVIASFLVPIAVIVLMANYVAFGDKPGAGADMLSEEAVARRLQPVGMIELRDASTPRVARTGEQMYAAVCSACHTAGALGAPKTGDAAAWAPRIATGYDSLLNSVVKGKGAMAALGGGDYSDYELGRAVVFITNQSGGNLAEPAAPAAPGAAASAASAAN